MNIQISKPYPHKKGYRCRFRTTSGQWRTCPSSPTEEGARLVAQQVAAAAEHESGQTVASCIDRYLEHHADQGTRPKSLVTYRQTLGRFFAPVLDRPLGFVTAARAASLYESLRKSCGTKTGRPIATDTHRNALVIAKGFAAWCVERRWLRVNPLAGVKGIGSKRRGKQQPTIDEARTLWAVCLREAGQGDDGALAAAIAISMGLRGGEIVSRVVRDLDNRDAASGLPQHLRIEDQAEVGFETKTRSSKRPVYIPQELRALLVARTRDKLPGALLFPSATGGLQWVSWVNRQVHRLCRIAGIRECCAHALRGCSATAAAAAGATPQLVAAMLGHSSTSVTLGHYVQAGTVEQVQRAEALKVLQGGK